MRPAQRAMTLAAALFAAGCGGGPPELMNVRSSSGTPDEFAILPKEPITIPETTGTLPTPTPGGPSRTDPTPEADAVAALGGDPRRLGAGAVPPADRALFSRATRFGLGADIRRRLAAEDLQFRRRNQGLLLERVFNRNVYYAAYAPLSLDQRAALERFRALGVRVPAAPPAEPED